MSERRELDLEGLDAGRWCVYALCNGSKQRPLYIGSSGNVVYRVGQHLARPQWRGLFSRVRILRWCESKQEAKALEVRLIHKHNPPWNVHNPIGRRQAELLAKRNRALELINEADRLLGR